MNRQIQVPFVYHEGWHGDKDRDIKAVMNNVGPLWTGSTVMSFLGVLASDSQQAENKSLHNNRCTCVSPCCLAIHFIVFIEILYIHLFGKRDDVWAPLNTEFPKWDISQVGVYESPDIFISQIQGL